MKKRKNKSVPGFLRKPGLRFEAMLFSRKSTGLTQIDKECDEFMYLCQNEVDGADCPDKLGYTYSYWFSAMRVNAISEIQNLKIKRFWIWWSIN